MKRALRSAASTNDAKNKQHKTSPPQTLTKSRSQRSRKDNKENATTMGKKNVPKVVVQPLQDKNAVTRERKSDKSTLSSVSTVDAAPMNVDSKPRNRRKLVDNKKSTEDEMVTEPNQPSSTSAPEKSVESVTVRKRQQSKAVEQLHSSEKDANRQHNRETSSSVQEMPAIDNEPKSTSQNIDEQKAVEKNSSKKAAVPFTVRTRSASKGSGESNVSSRTKQPKTQALKMPAKKPTVRTTSDHQAKNTAKITHKLEKKSAPEPKAKADTKETTQTAADPTLFVTIRRNRTAKTKAAAATSDDRPQPKEAIISNVTTRRRRANSQTVTKDNSKGVDSVTVIATNIRSKSVYRAASEKKMDTKSKVDAVVSPPKRRRIAKEDDPKIVGTITKQQQQPELLVNRSTASDSSDQSNGSAVPIYKRIGNTNNNTLDSVFDFESNSQENTLDNDEETQQVLAKLIRDKRASVAKRKGNRKKGVTKSQGNATRSRQIEKIRSDLKELKELKIRSTNDPAPSVRERRVISKPQPPRTENDTTNMRNPVRVVDLVVDEIVSEELSSKKSLKNFKVPSDNQPVDDTEHDVEGVQFDDDDFVVEDNASIHMPSMPLKLNSRPAETPPRQATYSGPRIESTLHQSTPVQIVQSGNASPWRLNSDGVKVPIFLRYSECEKSPIKSADVTKVTTEAKSPAKKPRLALARKPVAHMLLETEKPKTLENDIRNGFGFFDDDDDVGDDDADKCYQRPPSLPALQRTSVGLHGNASLNKPATLATSSKNPKKYLKDPPAPTSSQYFKKPQFNLLLEKVQRLKNTQTSVSSSMPKSASQSTIVTHFGGDASKPSSSRGAKITVNKNTYEEITRLPERSETDMTTYADKDALSLFEDKDALSLFETTWLTADDKPHRSYSRATRREPKRQNELKSSLLADDESECGESVVQKRTKRTKPKDDKYQEELRQFEENMISNFMDVDKFEMIMEKSVSTST